MRILLINPPGWQKGSTNLGLCYLAGNLIANSHEVLIFDLNEANEPHEALVLKTKEFAPDIIGFSLKTSTAKAAFLISKIIKKGYKKAVHVAGGPHITLDFKGSLLENTDIKYCFLGESDISFIDFVNRLEKKEPVEDIPGIAYVKNGKVVVTKQKYIDDLDALSYPSLEAIKNFNFKDFRYPIITSRGCPYLCTYCCVRLVCGSKWRPRSPENAIDELRIAKEKFGIKTFEILDDNFTLDRARAKRFCRLLIESRLRLSWYCHNGIRADRIDAELAKIMKKAGCSSVALGIESGNAEVFDSIKKGEPLEAIVDAVKCIKSAGMRVVGYFIIGLPGDSLDKFKRTIKFQQSLELDDYNYGILNPYPHTEVYDIIKRDGKILMDIKDSSHFSNDLTIPFEMPEFPKEDMEKAYYLAKLQKVQKALEDSENKHLGGPKRILYVDFSSSSKFIENLRKITDKYELDVFCSLWNSNNYYKNKEKWGIDNLYIYKSRSNVFFDIKAVLNLLYLLRKRKYGVVFYNLEASKKVLLLAFLIIKPSIFCIEADDGYRSLNIKDRKTKILVFKELVKFVLKLPVLIVAVFANILFRVVCICFALFLLFKRNGDKISFERPE